MRHFEFYVDDEKGDDTTADGTRLRPFKTIDVAIKELNRLNNEETEI